MASWRSRCARPLLSFSRICAGKRQRIVAFCLVVLSAFAGSAFLRTDAGEQSLILEYESPAFATVKVPMNSARPRPVMHTFFEDAYLAAGKDNFGLLGVWKAAWSAAGWEPRILTLDDAMRHPDYEMYNEKLLNEVPLGSNKEYDRMCYLRWLAMANVEGGGWMADNDVFPLWPEEEASSDMPYMPWGARKQDELSKAYAILLKRYKESKGWVFCNSQCQSKKELFEYVKQQLDDTGDIMREASMLQKTGGDASQLPLGGKFIVHCGDARSSPVPCLLSGSARAWGDMAKALLNRARGARIKDTRFERGLFSDMHALESVMNKEDPMYVRICVKFGVCNKRAVPEFKFVREVVTPQWTEEPSCEDLKPMRAIHLSHHHFFEERGSSESQYVMKNVSRDNFPAEWLPTFARRCFAPNHMHDFDTLLQVVA